MTIHDERVLCRCHGYRRLDSRGLLTGDHRRLDPFDGGDDNVTFPNVAAHAVNAGTLELG